MLSARRSSLLLCSIVLVARNIPAQDLVTTYKDLHSHPELSHHEERTSGILADALREAGYTVTDHIGRYLNGDSRPMILSGVPKPTLATGVKAMTAAAIAPLQ